MNFPNLPFPGFEIASPLHGLTNEDAPFNCTSLCAGSWGLPRITGLSSQTLRLLALFVVSQTNNEVLAYLSVLVDTKWMLVTDV